MQELLRARAHSLQAGQRTSFGEAALCPVAGPTREDLLMFPAKQSGSHAFIARQTLLGNRWAASAVTSDSAANVFREFLSAQVVQSRCVQCHVRGGPSEYTRLVFEPGSVVDHQSRNLAAFEEYVSSVPDGADIILDKIRGVAHGGALQVPSGTAEFANMERFLRLLDGANAGTVISPDSLFDGVTMASPARTLRRAALIFAGRIPTEEEINSVSDGTATSLRKAIRGLMQGKGFHEFLIRASNDRLLTDRHLFSVFDFRTETDLVDLANLQWRAAEKAIGRGYERAPDDPSYAIWEAQMQYGIARAPLELIAYVVENDRPYTEVLTADYIMANPLASKGYGASTKFDAPVSQGQFRLSRIVNYFRNDSSKISEFDVQYGTRIINSGALETTYPHAGILNTRVFLRRYPTTATNRNRARARWTLLHFLGVDVENLASRPTDSAALTETGNPAGRNQSCMACHSVLDPVAGAFQNYDAGGSYKSAFGGRDALPDSYKASLDGTPSPYRPGDTWYRDMAAPGFAGETAPDSGSSLQWLASKIAADSRFARGTVEFWWPAVMGQDVARAPSATSNLTLQGQLLASRAQAREVERLAAAFDAGIEGGSPYNARDLLTEMALSPWFRAESIASEEPVIRAALEDAGTERLLSPEELARKTDSITGYRWGRHTRGFIHEVGYLDGEGAGKGGPYELLYGGIDSDGIARRARSVTPLMAAAAQGHAIRTSCAIVQREFYLWSEDRRMLFDGIDADTTPVSARSATAAAAIRRASAGGSWRGQEAFQQASGVGARLSREGSQAPDWPDYSLEGFSQARMQNRRPAANAADMAIARNPPSGAMRIRRKLVDLHWKLFGVPVAVDSPDVEVAYRLFVGVWERKRATEGGHFSDSQTQCPIEDTRYFEGIIDDAVLTDEHGSSKIDWNRVKDSWHFDMHDPSHAVRTWVVVLAYLMSDYRYLYL